MKLLRTMAIMAVFGMSTIASATEETVTDPDVGTTQATVVNTNNNTTTDYTGNTTSNNTNVNTNTNNNNNVNTSTSVATNTNNNNNINTTDYTGVSTNTNTNTNNNNTIVNSTSENTNTNNNVTDYTGTSTNTNVNTNNSTSNNTNNNTNTNNNFSESSSNNTNNNFSESTSNSNNVNTNNSTSESTSTSNVTSESTSSNTNNNTNINKNETVQKIEQDIKSPPPSAIAPSIGSSYSQDLCTTGIGGAVQTQLFGISGGKSVRDMNCERIKLSKTMYDMGMKVAAVSLMCQDDRVWEAMRMAGTPCPFEGAIGSRAMDKWKESPHRAPEGVTVIQPKRKGEHNGMTYDVYDKSDFCATFPESTECL